MLHDNIKYFILLECGLCYVIPYLRKRNRGAKIISLHISGDYNDFVPPQNIPDAEWCPESGMSCADFLEKEIEDIESDKIKIIEWRPSLSVYAEKYLALLKEAARFIKWADANKRTLTHFSDRWQRNAEKNIKIARGGQHKYPPPKKNTKNIIICASGPSLENDIDIIKEMKAQTNCEVLAVSSAYSALVAHDIVPDIMITSDGGNWARFHLYEAARFSGKLLVVAALHSALLSDFSEFPLLLFSEQERLAEEAIPYVTLPARGTVTANAIDFALLWTEGDIYITGLDLSNNDGRTHARPYSFDMLLWQQADRFNPYYHQHYKRARAIEEGGTYTIYREWFEKELPKYPPRLFIFGIKKIKCEKT